MLKDYIDDLDNPEQNLVLRVGTAPKKTYKIFKQTPRNEAVKPLIFISPEHRSKFKYSTKQMTYKKRRD
jgi:predicted urease superfamily metal-dependent hydrolase